MEENQNELDAHKTEEIIRFFVFLAAFNDAGLPCDQLLSLLPRESPANLTDLQKFIRERVTDVCIIDGIAVPADRPGLASASAFRRKLSLSKIRFTREFVETHPRVFSDTSAVGVTGSTSYLSSSDHDDLDILIVSQRPWLNLIKLLLYLRARWLLTPFLGRLPDFCVSMMFTPDELIRFVSTRVEPLTARELLNIRPVKGSRLIHHIISRSTWIRAYFPRAQLEPSGFYPQVSGGQSTLNILCYRLLGSYLWATATVRNYLFRRKGLYDRLFAVIKSPTCLLYESNRYRKLRTEYRRFFNVDGHA